MINDERSLHLCQECYCWVVPHDGRCPDCSHVADASVPQPHIDDLQRVIGTIVRRIGEVRFQRYLLPESGTLYHTANGLYFVPHVLRRRQEYVERTLPGRSLFWIIASYAFGPLMLILPFIRSKKKQWETVTVFRPANLRLDEGHRLAELLTKNPGAFFIPEQSIRHITRKRGKWVIDRRYGGRLRFSAIINEHIVAQRMTDLANRESWRERADV